jgi:hypothetical protein
MRQSSWAYLVVEAVISAEWCEVNYANVDFIEVTWGGAAAAAVKNRCVAITIFCRLWRGDQQDTKNSEGSSSSKEYFCNKQDAQINTHGLCGCKKEAGLLMQFIGEVMVRGARDGWAVSSRKAAHNKIKNFSFFSALPRRAI